MSEQFTVTSERLPSFQLQPKQSPVTLSQSPAAARQTCEDLLNRDPRWALSEGSRHFDEQSSVFMALRNMARRLDEIGVLVFPPNRRQECLLY